MATRAERAHAEEQKKGPNKKTKKKAAAKKQSANAKKAAAKGSRDKTHAGNKATYALEETPKSKRPSRKSTRKAANRSKPDSALNRTEQHQQGSPEAVARRAGAKRTRVKGKKP